MTEQSNSYQPDNKTLFWNRVQLLAVCVVFIAPIVGAFVYKPTKFNNYGDLYTPARELAPLFLKPITSDELPFSSNEMNDFSDYKMQDLWAFLVVAKGGCNKECERSILNSRQLRAMQGKHLERLRGVLIYSEMTDQAALDLALKYQPIQVFKANSVELETWAEQLVPEGVSTQEREDRFYVVDSKGLLMISYPSTAQPKLINKDLKRLLKARR